VFATAAGLLMVVVSWGWLDDNRRARAAESRALIEARHGEQVLDFLLDAIAAAEPGQSRGRDVSVQDIVDRSYARVTRD
ncbi:hypothetical protein Q6325_30080, partial [Klebsiella pneumoniae]|uniref:hypothetical protein n=1 Tax=Klebsiella pneumoniae TaxID=573 RepID=UPI002730B62E